LDRNGFKKSESGFDVNKTNLFVFISIHFCLLGRTKNGKVVMALADQCYTRCAISNSIQLFQNNSMFIEYHSSHVAYRVVHRASLLELLQELNRSPSKRKWEVEIRGSRLFQASFHDVEVIMYSDALDDMFDDNARSCIIFDI